MEVNGMLRHSVNFYNASAFVIPECNYYAFRTASEAFGFCSLDIIWMKLGIRMQREKPTA